MENESGFDENHSGQKQLDRAGGCGLKECMYALRQFGWLPSEESQYHTYWQYVPDEFGCISSTEREFCESPGTSCTLMKKHVK